MIVYQRSHNQRSVSLEPSFISIVQYNNVVQNKSNKKVSVNFDFSFNQNIRFRMADLVKLPQKRFYRQRAHSNPLAHHNFNYPVRPSDAVWDEQYPERGERQVEILDIGCGYGGLLIQLAPHFPESLLLGLEIRVKVSVFIPTPQRLKRTW